MLRVQELHQDQVEAEDDETTLLLQDLFLQYETLSNDEKASFQQGLLVSVPDFRHHAGTLQGGFATVDASGTSNDEDEGMYAQCGNPFPRILSESTVVPLATNTIYHRYILSSTITYTKNNEEITKHIPEEMVRVLLAARIHQLCANPESDDEFAYNETSQSDLAHYFENHEGCLDIEEKIEVAEESFGRRWRGVYQHAEGDETVVDVFTPDSAMLRISGEAEPTQILTLGDWLQRLAISVTSG